MSAWPGWEDFAPTPTSRPASGSVPTSVPKAPRTPRVKGYRAAWVHRDALTVTRKPQAGDDHRWLRFDSVREAERYAVLRARELAGEIADLRRQVAFPLNVTRPDGHTETVCRYIADFVWFEAGRRVVADAKGMRTEVYGLKRKWMRAQYGIEILEL